MLRLLFFIGVGNVLYKFKQVLFSSDVHCRFQPALTGGSSYTLGVFLLMMNKVVDMSFSKNAARFRELHKTGFVLANAWDALSALAVEQSGFQAIGTTSKGVANALGFDDGEVISFTQLQDAVARMLLVTTLPITVDIEKGFAHSAAEIAEHVVSLARLGVVGINIEDSNADYSALMPIEVMIERIAAVRAACAAQGFDELFINVRIDAFLQGGNPVPIALERANAFVNAGADGVFFPGLVDSQHIAELTKLLHVPVNVMTLPQHSNADHFIAQGIKRVSIGNGLADHMARELTRYLDELKLSNDAKAFVHSNSVNIEFLDTL